MKMCFLWSYLILSFLQYNIFYPDHSVKLIELQVDPAKVDFSFQENIGLQIEIKDMTFSLEIQREAKLPVLQIKYVQLQH